MQPGKNYSIDFFSSLRHILYHLQLLSVWVPNTLPIAFYSFFFLSLSIRDHFWLNEGWTTWLQRKIMARMKNNPKFLDFDAIEGRKVSFPFLFLLKWIFTPFMIFYTMFYFTKS
jgi:hypothetical protein